MSDLVGYLSDPPSGGNHYVGSPYSIARMKEAATRIAELEAALADAQERCAVVAESMFPAGNDATAIAISDKIIDIAAAIRNDEAVS